jgi:hypothetical protein
MTHVVLEQLATQRQAELARRATRQQRTRRRRVPTTTIGTRQAVAAATLLDRELSA